MTLVSVLLMFVGIVIVAFVLLQYKRPRFWKEWINRESRINSLNAELELQVKQIKILQDGLARRDLKIMELNNQIASHAEEYMIVKLENERQRVLITEYENICKMLDESRQKLKTLKTAAAA